MIPAINMIPSITTIADSSSEAPRAFFYQDPSDEPDRMLMAKLPDDSVSLPEESIDQLRLIEKSVIIHKDENGFGLRLKGQAPVFVDHVHENGAAWRVGVRSLDQISKVNGVNVLNLDHKEVVLMFKACSRFVGLSLLSSESTPSRGDPDWQASEASDKLGSSELARDDLETRKHRLPQHILMSFHKRQSSSTSLLLPLKQAGQQQLSTPEMAPASASICEQVGQSQRHPLSRLLEQRARRAGSTRTKSGANRKQEEFKGKLAGGIDRSISMSVPDAKKLPLGAKSSQVCANCRQEVGSQAESCSCLTKAAARTNSEQQVHQKLLKPPKVAVNKRLEIIRELIDTEKTHTERLRNLDELFYKPLKLGNYMTGEQLKMVFSCHRTLYKIHRQIYRILLSANYGLYSEPMVGSALLEIFEGELKRRLERAACSFCSAQSLNNELLNKLTRRDTKVGEFIAQITSQQMINRLGIKDLLASCFQRLTKYPLLLENLLKATPSAPPPPVSPPGRSLEEDCEAEESEEDDEEAEEEAEKARNSRRMLAISLAEEREFIERALLQSRQILFKVNESIRVALSRQKLREIWKRTDKYPGVPLIDITKQQVLHEGFLTLRLSKRSFDVYMLLLNDYIVILTREGHDKYRLKFFSSPEGKAPLTSGGELPRSTPQPVYSPVFVIDEHLTTRDAATDENGFYLLCKRRDDSRIYEFASRSPAERINWRDKIQWTIERQMSKQSKALAGSRRQSYESGITKSSSEISSIKPDDTLSLISQEPLAKVEDEESSRKGEEAGGPEGAPTKIEGTISYVEDDGIVMPSKMESSQALVDRAVHLVYLQGSN